MDIKIYDKLAKKYDLATKIVSFGIEEVWRKIFIKNIKKHIKNGSLIDLASATGEMAKGLNFDKAYLIEPSRAMNLIATEKLKNKSEKCEIEELSSSKFQVPSWRIKCGKKEIIIIQDTAENFNIDEKADLITAFMAFRNFDDIKKASRNIDKHLKNGGYLAVVEMVKSDSFLAKLILWYMNNIVPLIAGVLVGMKQEYKLLGKSIDSLSQEDIIKNFKDYEIITKKKLLFPIASMVIMRKNDTKDS